MKKFWSMQKSKVSNEGEIYLYGEIASASSWWSDNVTPTQFQKDLASLGDIKVLNVYMNSLGGEVFAGQAIHNMIQRCTAEVRIHVDGIIASIATVIAMAGTIYMPRNAMMMIHNPWSRVAGNADDLRKMATDLDKIAEAMVAAYETKAKITRDEIIGLMKAETWLTAEEAFALGFCDVITDAKEMAASISAGIFSLGGQEIPIANIQNVAQLLAKFSPTLMLGESIIPKKEEPVMDFKTLTASLPLAQQNVINAHVTSIEASQTQKVTELQAALDTANENLRTAQEAAQASQATATLTDEAFLASLPEPVRARYVADQASANAAIEKAAVAEAAAKLQNFVQKAKAFDKIPVKADDFGKVLMAVSDAVPEAFAQIEATLAAVNAALETSIMFEAMGSGQAKDVDPLVAIEAKALELQAADAAITKEQAFAKACKDNPALYNAYQKSMRGEE